MILILYFKNAVKMDLKKSRDLEVTISSGRQFQSVVVLGKYDRPYVDRHFPGLDKQWVVLHRTIISQTGWLPKGDMSTCLSSQLVSNSFGQDSHSL